MKNGWIMEDAGWYFHDTLGSICKEKDGWYVYNETHEDGFGAFKTLKAAKQHASGGGGEKCQD